MRCSECIGCVGLLTTGTVKFSDELLKVLENNDILVRIDNYGNHISEKLQEIVFQNLKILEHSNVIYKIIDNESGTWYDLGDYHKREDSDSIKKFQTCFNNHCLFLTPKGTLSWCQRNATCIDYNLIPDFKEDYCNLEMESGKKIRDVLSLKYVHGCEYCNGSGTDNIIAAGIQKSN